MKGQGKRPFDPKEFQEPFPDIGKIKLFAGRATP
jgi:hypothetical protein